MRVIEQNRFAKKKARLFVAIEREIQSVMKRKRTASHHYVLDAVIAEVQRSPPNVPLCTVTKQSTKSTRVDPFVQGMLLEILVIEECLRSVVSCENVGTIAPFPRMSY